MRVREGERRGERGRENRMHEWASHLTPQYRLELQEHALDRLSIAAPARQRRQHREGLLSHCLALVAGLQGDGGEKIPTVG